MPTLPQGRLWVLSSSIVCSCVVMGISISLLFANKSSMDLYTNSPPNSANKWRQQPGSNPNPNPGPNPNLTPRDEPTYFDADEFQPSEILAIVSSALNWLVATVLIVISARKRKTFISVVAVEAPCIYVVSFMWLATAAYAEHLGLGNPVFIPYLNPRDCIRHKVMEGFAFINWIQLMLYANTLMTVATICHVRRRPVWYHPVTELPTLGAPALTFDSGPDMEFDSPFMRQTNESETPILGTSSSNVNPRAPSHFRSRITFPQHSTHRTGTLSALPSLLPTSESVESLAPSVSSTQADVTSQNPVSHSQPRTFPRIVPMGEPPTYSDPGAGYQSEPV